MRGWKDKPHSTALVAGSVHLHTAQQVSSEGKNAAERKHKDENTSMDSIREGRLAS